MEFCLLDEDEIRTSYEGGTCPFCNSRNIFNAVYCTGYEGFICECENDSGACKYCFSDDQEPLQDVYLCGDCYKGYDLRVNLPIQDLFLYRINPGNAFEHNIIKAIELCTQFPDQSITMAVSALDSYFYDRFVSIVNSNSRYKFGELFAKSQSFQNLGKVNELYKKAFDIDIKRILNAVDPDLYTKITRIVAVRNVIIHNAGIIDKQLVSTIPQFGENIGSRIHIDETLARKSIKHIDDAVKAIEKKIDFNFKITSKRY